MRRDEFISAIALSVAPLLWAAPLSAQFSPRIGGMVGRPNRTGRFQGKHWGTIRRDGSVAIKFEHQSLERSGGLLISTQGAAQFLIKNDGEKISAPYSAIFPMQGGYQIGENLNPGFAQGFLDESGKVIAQPRYESITSPAFGIIVVRSGAIRGWINPKTRALISPELHLDFVQALAPDLVIGVQVWQKRVLGFHVDGQSRFETPASDWPVLVGKFLRVPQDDRSVRWIDQDGKEIAPGQSSISSSEELKDSYTPYFEGGKWGFKDGKGNVIVKPILDNPGAFMNGLATPVLNGKQGVMDTKGRWVIPPEFELLSESGPDGWRVGTRDRKLGVWLRIGPKGESLKIPGHWSYIEPFDSQGQAVAIGFASTALKGKKGVMNTKGRLIVPPEFESLSEPDPNGWRVGTRDPKQGVWLRIGPMGETLEIPGHWSYIEPFDSQGQAIAVEF